LVAAETDLLLCRRYVESAALFYRRRAAVSSRAEPVHDVRREHVVLVEWPAGERFQLHAPVGGEGVLVLSGEFEDDSGSDSAGTWLRSSQPIRHHAFVDEAAVIWAKVGHSRV